MPKARSDKRSERYHFLRGLGFTPDDAKLWSHRSGQRQLTEVNQRYDTISAIRNRDRTFVQQKYLNNVRASRIEPEQTERVLFTERDRADQWREWSDKFGDGFPDDKAAEIVRLNLGAGLSPNDRFGYRAYYYYYVLGEDASDAVEIAAGYEEE